MTQHDQRWQAYRKTYLHLNPLCVRCQSMGTMSPAVEVVHITPVVGGQDDPLFWRRSNHQGLCESCCARKAAKEEGAP